MRYSSCAKKSSLLGFAVTLLVLCSFSRAQEFYDISYGNTYHMTQPEKSTQLFKFVAPQPEVDLTVYITSNGDNFLRMFTSKNRMGLTSDSSKIDYFTIGTHFLLIDIKKDQLPKIDPERLYFVGVDCVSAQPCDYQLRLEHPANISAGVNEKVYLYGTQEGSDSVINFNIPHNESTERVVFSAVRLYTRSNSSTPLNIYLARKDDNTETPSFSMVELETAWDSGLAGIAHKKQLEFCTGCNWTMRAFYSDPLIVQATAYGAIERLKQYIKFHDVALIDNKNTYVINLEEDHIASNASLLITFEFYEGSVTYYLNPETLPNRLEDYLWNITSYGEEVLRISPAERKKLGFNKKIYITVCPQQTVAYSLTYRSMNSDSHSWYGGQTLSPEKTYMSFIQDREVQTFWFHTKCNISTNLGVFANTGNVHVAVVRCEYQEDCYLKAANFSNISALNKLVYNSNSSKMWKSGTFNATTGFSDYCHYSINILGASNNNSSDESSFEIWVDQPNTVTRLAEGLTFKTEMAAYVTREFVFKLLNDTDVERVTFKVTPLSGKGKYTLNFFPAKHLSANGFMTTSTAWSLDVVRTSWLPTLQGDYELSLTALEASIFFITPVLHRKNNTSNQITHKPITLPAGTSIRYSIKKDEVAYFQFRTNFPESYNGSISIFIQPIRGKVACFMNVDNRTLPSNKTKEYNWRSWDNELIVFSNFEDFQPNGLYQIAVYPQPYNKSNYYDTYSFTIAYVNSEEFIYLRDSYPFEFTVSKETPIFFEIDYSPDDGDLTFTKSSRSDYEIYVSSDHTIIFPNQTKYTARTQNTYSVTLKERDLKRACSFANSTSKFERCTIYASAYSNFNYSVGVYLIASKSKRATDLIEGMSAYQPVLSNYSYHFNFHPTILSNLLVVKVWSQYRKVSVYAKVQNYKTIDIISIGVPELKYPTKDEWDFSAKVTGANEVNEYREEFMIPAIDLAKLCRYDEHNCAVTLTVYPESNWDIDAASDTEPPVFIIMISGDYQRLTSHAPIYDFIFKEQIKYFEFSIKKSKCQNCNLTIDVTTFDQTSPIIYISKGTTSRPTPEDSDFNSEGSHLKLTKGQVIAKSYDFYGDWTVGVYSRSDVAYYITASFDDNSETVIMSGHPFEFSLEDGDRKTFQYFLDKPAEIEIRTFVELGSSALTDAFTFKDEKNRDKPIPSHFTHKTMADGSTLLVLSEEVAKKISPCYVSITVQSTQSSSTAGNIVVLHPHENIVLLEGQFYSDTLEPGDKLYFKYHQVQALNKEEASNTSNYIDVALFAGNVTASVYTDASRQSNSLILKKIPWKGEHFFGLYPKSLPKSESKPFTSFFVELEAHTHAKFSIVAGSQDKQIKLTDGVMHTDFLNQDQEILYSLPLPSFNEKDPFEVKINLNLYNYEFGTDQTKFFGDIFRLMSIGFPTLVEASLVVKETNQGEFRTGVYFTANYTSEKDKSGDYFASQLLIIGSHEIADKLASFQGMGQSASLVLRLKNPGTLAMKYAIFVQVSKPLALPVGGLHFSRVSDKHKAIYEIYAIKAGILAIELIECYGKVRIDATDSIEKLNSNQWDLKVNLPSEEALYGNIKINNPGSVYVRVSLLDGLANSKRTNEKEALYRFQTRLFQDQNSLPYNSFYPGKNGIISWNITLQDELKVDFIWGDASVDSTEEIFKYYDVEPIYNTYLAKDRLTLEAYSKCGVYVNDIELAESHEDFLKSSKIYGLKAPNLKEFEDKTLSQRNYTFSFQQDNQTVYYGAVVAKLNGYSHGENYTSWSIPLIYETVQISLNAQGSLTPKWIVVAVVVLTIAVLVVAILLVRYYKRYKLTKARLQFEMQDIRNVANVVSEEVMDQQVEKAQQERHTALVEEPQK